MIHNNSCEVKPNCYFGNTAGYKSEENSSTLNWD